MIIKNEEKDTSRSVGAMRFVPPFEMHDDCPDCGQSVKFVGSLHAPRFNERTIVRFSCRHRLTRAGLVSPVGKFGRFAKMPGFEDSNETTWTRTIIMRCTAEVS